VSPPTGSTFAPQQPLLAPVGSLMTPNGMAISLHHNISTAPAPGPASFSIMPTQVLAPLQTAPPLIVHQHSSNATATIPATSGPKRKRVDMPTPVYAVGNSLQAPHFTTNAQMVGMVAVAGRGRQKSQAQIDRRRERNRILARRTRLRKKFFFESLQKEVNDLQRENNVLKDLVKKKFNAEDAKQLLSECNAMASLPRDVQEAVFENADLDNQDFNLVRSIQRSQQCFVITDPSLQDNPIVYASDDFLSLTGYERDEVLGRNCRFLQGTETSTEKVEKLRKSIALGEDVSVTLINYTADGTAFWNKLFIAALRDAHNNIVNFIGVVVKVASPEGDDPEAGKRLPGEQVSSSNGDIEIADDDDYEEDFSG
jgi:PAS domain S-box-containing protein